MNSAELPGEAPDVLVVGAGNAALCAAISAHENGARVLMLEAAPFEERGGNSHFTGGAFRFAFRGVDDLIAVLPSLAQEDLENVDFGTYTRGAVLRRPVRPDPIPVRSRSRGNPGARQSRHREVGGAAGREAAAGARTPGLQGRRQVQVLGRPRAAHLGRRAGTAQGALCQCGAARHPHSLRDAGDRASSARTGGSRGVVAEYRGAPVAIRAGAVVLACGSFESNPEMRARYLGPGWEIAKVRGTRFNMGAGLDMALRIGARPYGNWSGCHSVAWDINAPPYGDLTVGDQFQKHNYPFGILVNAKGERYVDEGANFHSHTYAKYGGEIVKLPGMFAWQVFDAKVSHLLARRVSHPPRDQGGSRHAGRTGRQARRRRRRRRSCAPCANSTPPAAPMCRSIPMCWMAAGRRGSPSTRPTGPIRSIPRRSTPIT